MLHEFAVEPKSLACWNPLWLALEQFGIHHGRMISRFPKRWERMVWDLLNQCPQKQRWMLEERLRRLKRKMIATGREFDPAKDWLANAEGAHAILPFRAIICAENALAAAHVLTGEQLHEDNQLWKVARECCVPRQAVDMAKCVAPVLSLADEVLFVDPHFRPEQRFTEPLAEFLTAAHCRKRQLKRIEYHVAWVDWWSNFCNECERWLPHRIPVGLELRIVAWRERPRGEKLHPRYILTNVGGVRFEVGLDSGDSGQTCDVSLLDQDLYLKRWADFQLQTAAFDYKDELRILGNSVL